eukprot:TRINITY_DN12457_c1_g1_i1.p1 TRINITY_DN12457_c1_g1~~TRINITY_DN12457_c1_g1_i1.p1  ORF type:complete len:170 (-),score=50.01 TRINITY_DN12457_c1_g1_i1:54-563(-)
MSDMNVNSIQDPWEKWVVQKAIGEHKARLRKEKELESLRRQEQLRSASDRRMKERNEEVYSKWLMDKKLAYMKRTADKMTSESAALADVERKQNIQEEKAEKNFREWTKAKKSEKERTDNMRQLQLERERENRQLARLKAAEAYEQWLIQHPHKILPTPSFINPQAWDN